MSVDKLVDSTQLDADLTSVANAIRTKGGTSAQLAFPAGFVSAVEAIPTGGQSEPVYGLLQEYTISEAVSSFSYSIPETARNYPLLIQANLSLSASDYIYCYLNNQGQMWSAKGTTFKRNFQVIGVPQKNVSGITFVGFTASSINNSTTNCYAQSTTRTTPYNTLLFRGYSTSTKFTGTIKIFGRVS